MAVSFRLNLEISFSEGTIFCGGFVPTDREIVAMVTVAERQNFRGRIEAERRGPEEFLIGLSGQKLTTLDSSPIKFSGFLVLMLIGCASWTKSPIADLSGPGLSGMAKEGDWSGIRDATEMANRRQLRYALDELDIPRI